MLCRQILFLVLLIGSDAQLFGFRFLGGGPATLFGINEASGASTSIGPVGFSQCGGADVHPFTGVVYAGCGTNLVTINTATGAGTLVGVMSGTSNTADIAFRSDGVLFLVNPSYELFTVDTATGIDTLVGVMAPLSGAGLGLTFDNLNRLILSTGGGPAVMRNFFVIDQATAEAVVLSPLLPICVTPDPLFTRYTSLTTKPDGTILGTLACEYGSSTDGALAVVNPNTGAGVAIGQTGRMDGLFYVTPASLIGSE